MNVKKLSVSLVLLILFATGSKAQGDHIGSAEMPAHPRILLLKNEEAGIRKNIAADPIWANMHQAIIDESDRMIGLPPLERIQIGRRLLDKSREAIRRLFFLSYAWRMTQQEKYLQRAEKEMLTIAAFSDWNPSHFLDVAEMTMAMAIGYDWLFDKLSASSKATIREAILKKGLEPSLDNRYNSWLRAEHNWNQVCNAGMTYGSIAIFEDNPAMSKNIINRAIESIQLAMKDYGPDGAYPEGYGYWGYGTSFNVMFNSAVEKLFGKDFGLNEKPGFLLTGGYLENMTGPSGNPFNYSDAGGRGGLQPAMFWFAARRKDPTLLWVERSRLASADPKSHVGNRLLPAIMIWSAGIDIDQIKAPASAMYVGKGKVPVALMRSSWTDPNAIYVGFKGGSVSVNHAHMDIGSFVMEADGVRWAIDFGMQEYESLESKGIQLFGRTQNAQRWTVFRLTNLVHNTLTVNNQHQRVTGTAPFTGTASSPNFMNAVTDMSEVYTGALAKANRGIAIVDKQYVVVRDEIEALDTVTTIRWTLLTPADVKITGPNKAELTKDGKKIMLQVESPVKVTMKTWSTDPPNSYDAPNPGTILTGFEVTIPAKTKLALTVSLVPEKAAGKAKKKIPALKEWNNEVAPPHAFDADLDIIRKRIIDDLLSLNVAPENIRQLTTTIKPDGTWPGIDYKDTSRTGFEHRIHLDNMVTLARAWRKNKDEEAKKALSSALDFWLKNDFICQNWWWNEMGTPNLMINTLLLLDTELTEQQRKAGLNIARRANLEAWGARPSGDRIQIAGMLGKQALFLRASDTLDRVVKEMGSEIKIKIGVGLNPDLSFHHRTDNVISTLSYGTGYAGAFAFWAAKTVGTKYALPQDKLKLLIDYYLDGICASMAFGKIPDPGARNRDISRRQTGGGGYGAELAENLLLSSNYRSKELQDIVKNRKGDHPVGRTKDHFFWHSEYFTHQRPAYFASVRMHSSRGNNMEQPHNEEGLKNHHYGDGSTWITVTGNEYVNIFPAFDFQKIPGATIVQQPALPHWNQLAKKGLTDFVGGVTDGRYGAAAIDFACVHDPLKARKAYFFFDKEFVCLGTAIQSRAEYPVVTTLNQCLLNGDVIVQTTNGQQRPAKGKHTLNDVQYVWHDNVAYLFPEPIDINCNNTAASGSWRSINHQSWATDEPVQKDIFCLWLDHGPRPTKAGYAYIVAPAIVADAVANYSKKTSIEILSNTAAIQAVRNNALQVTQVVFYEAGEIKLSENVSVRVDQPCMLMLTGKSYKNITASDPTRKLKTLQVTVTSGKKSKEYKVDLPVDGYAGQSIRVL